MVNEYASSHRFIFLLKRPYIILKPIEIKIKYAESDQERNALQLKLKERNETLKKFSSEITKYEFEMVKAKQCIYLHLASQDALYPLPTYDVRF